jgi:glycerol uptake facilitator-like aquaporin
VTLSRRATAEAVATGFLVMAVVGSGIMASRLAPEAPAVALLANTVATGAALAVLILTFGPVSGAHMNPLITLVDAVVTRRPARDVTLYVVGQTLGGIAGVIVANLMFGLPALALARQARTGGGQLLGEVVATFGLVVVVFVGARYRPASLPYAVAAHITAAYWFTSSTSFANPAVTIARSLSDTFTGIRPTDVPAFVAAQAVGATFALGFARWLTPATDANDPKTV